MTTSDGVMDRLRNETRDLHDRAEGRDLQRRMIAGEITRDEYVDWLRQMLHVHRALERHLLRRVLCDPLFAAVRQEQFQELNLVADLAAMACDPDGVEPLPAARALIGDIERVAEDEPLALLGYHYVLEGSKNGNRFIVRKLAPTLGLAARRADRYLDPFGDSQPAKWAEFKAQMNTLGFDQAQIDVIVAAARRMFEGISQLSEELVGS